MDKRKLERFLKEEGPRERKRETLFDIERDLRADPLNQFLNIKYQSSLQRLGMEVPEEVRLRASTDSVFMTDDSEGNKEVFKIDKFIGAYWEGDQYVLVKAEGKDINNPKIKRIYWIWLGDPADEFDYDSNCIADIPVEPQLPDYSQPPDPMESSSIFYDDYYVVKGKDKFGHPLTVYENFWEINKIERHNIVSFIVSFLENANVEPSPYLYYNYIRPKSAEEYADLYHGAVADSSTGEVVTSPPTRRALHEEYFRQPDLMDQVSRHQWNQAIDNAYNDWLLHTIGHHASLAVGFSDEMGSKAGFFNEDNIDFYKKVHGLCHKNRHGLDSSWVLFPERPDAGQFDDIMSSDADYAYFEGLDIFRRDMRSFKNILLEWQILSKLEDLQEGEWIDAYEISESNKYLIDNLGFEPKMVFIEREEY